MGANKGKLVDLITLDEFIFEYEPHLEDHETTKWGIHGLMGRELPIAQWISSEGKKLDLKVHLIGGSTTSSDPVTPDQIAKIRYDTVTQYQRQVLKKVGVNPDGTDKMAWVQNSEPPPEPLSALEAKQRIKEKRKQASMGVMEALRKLEKLQRTQPDIGAPHPVGVFYGDRYLNRKFVISEVKVKTVAVNIENQNPYEAEVEIKLQEVDVSIGSK